MGDLAGGCRIGNTTTATKQATVNGGNQLWSIANPLLAVDRLEIIVPVGWALNTNN